MECVLEKKENISKKEKLVRAHKSWEDIGTHYLSVINDEWYKTIFKLNNTISVATVKYYENRGIKTMHLPITTGTISSPMGLGSDSSPVKVNLCGVETYLADSMQFMLEYGCRLNEKGCYYIMPSFRGENADNRHLCQFFHSEAEIPGEINDVINLVEDYLQFLCNEILENNSKEILKCVEDLSHIKYVANKNVAFPRITLDEAIKLFDTTENGNELYDVNEELGFRSINQKGEKMLMSHFGGFVWLTHFDHLSVPFYQAFSDEVQTTAINADLLFGIGEIVGSGERHQNIDEVSNALSIHGVDYYEYEWYCEMKSKFPIKTSGFGMGIERFLLWILKHDDIRDCQILPRFNGVNILP